MANIRKILVVGELVDGNVASILGELLGVGRRLAGALGGELSIVFLGSNIRETARQAFAQGADSVYVADAPAIEDYQPELYANVIEKICKELAPNVLILGARPLGRDLAPRLSWRLKSDLASDCVELGIDPDTNTLIATRPVYGGKAMAEVDYGITLPAMAIVRPKSQAALQPDPSRTGEVISVVGEIDHPAARTKIVSNVTVEVNGIKLEDARIEVGGGRGIGSAEHWKVLEALADDLKGAVGSTRGACDKGYSERAIQLGISSKRVAPELYLAVGIFGASQHMTGVSFSKHIACINRDAEAPIFREAEFGVVKRREEYPPAFHRKVKELLSR